jgi:antitoxin (DNA-binding transcriptional repressor) of toxin-antitoxin stability system
VLPSAIAGYHGRMSGQIEISQRDLRLRSKEIMDSVERGQSFTVTRDGHQIGELIPLRQPRTFVSREQFLAGYHDSGPIDLDRFRADLDIVIDNEASDPYER